MKAKEKTKCYYCKRTVYKGEVITTVTASFNGWTSDPHTVCRNCAESMGTVIKDDEENEVNDD